MARLLERPHVEAKPWANANKWSDITGEGQNVADAREPRPPADQDWHSVLPSMSSASNAIGWRPFSGAPREETGRILRFGGLGVTGTYLFNSGRAIEYAAQPPLERLDYTGPQHAERLRLLSNLEANWDGYGANVITETAVDRCAKLLNNLLSESEQHCEGLFIAPLADGGIELEWEWDSGNELMLVIPPTAQPLEYLATTVDQSIGEEREHEGTIGRESSLGKLLRRLSA